MAGITTRTTAGAGATVKNAVLTAAEMDANFLGINDEIFVDGLPTVKPSLVLDFVGSAQIDPRITFTRASTATFYDAGSTAKAEENFVNNSTANTWVSAWNAAVAVTANFGAAPDGTMTATRIVSGASGGQSAGIGLSVGTLNGLVYTFSFYVKYVDHRYIAAGITDTGNRWGHWTFDVVTQSLVYTAASGSGGFSSLSGSVVNVGGGWYRCTGTGTCSTANSMGNLYVGFAQDASGTGLTTGGLISWFPNPAVSCWVWGAQLEQRSQATAYTPTTTSAITRYQPRLMTAPANAPRLDFDPVTREPGGLLVELAATNLIFPSADFASGKWASVGALYNASIVAKAAIAPDGTLTADYLKPSAAGLSYVSYLGNNASSGQTLVFSVFVKATTLTSVSIQVDFAWAQGGASFSLVGAGSVTGGANATIVAVGNGWYRISSAVTLAQARADAGIALTATSDQSGFYIWGAQLEAGSFATSYIPTTSAQVTRARDNANITGSNFTSWYNYQEGTQYVESRINEIFPGVIGFTNAAPGPEFYRTNQVDTWVIGVGRQLSSSRMRFATVALGQGLAYNGASAAGGSGNADADADLSTNRNYWKFAAAIKSGDSALYWRSTLAQGGSTSAAAGRLPEPIALGFGSNAYLYAAFSGHIRKFVYYPKRLTNTQLQYLIK